MQGVARSEQDAQKGWYILDGTLGIPGPNTDFPFTTALTLTYSATVNLSCTDLDLTGDGIPDAAFWDPDEKKIGLYEGWDIPWGDPNW